jgi:CheY-like chemotaxis protein
MTPAGRAIDVLLVEDDPGDVLITREVLEHNTINNVVHVASDGRRVWTFCTSGAPTPTRPSPT